MIVFALVASLLISFNCCAMQAHYRRSELITWTKHVVYCAKLCGCGVRVKCITSNNTCVECDDLIRTCDGVIWKYDVERAQYISASHSDILKATTIFDLGDLPDRCGSWAIKTCLSNNVLEHYYQQGRWNSTDRNIR